MVEASTEYRKNGFNDQDAAQLAKITAIFQNVSDEATRASEAASIIISQLIAFGYSADESQEKAMHFVDALNEVANSFAVSTGDLANGLKVVASSSATMGNSLEETIGLMVGVTEITRNANKASRGLNTIMANLAQVLDDTSSNGVKIKEIYESLGLAMEDSNGQLKSGYTLLSDLAGKWNTLDGDTQKYIATTIAGTTQLNTFVSLMSNFDHATSATATALNSAGSAAEENSRYMGGLQAKVSAISNEFENFSNNVISNETVGALLDLGKTLLELSNNPVGAFLTRFALASSVTLGASIMFTQLAVKVLPMLKAAFVAAAGGALTLQAALGWISLALGVVAAALPAIIDAWNDSHKSVKELSDELTALNNQLSTNKDRIEEINNLTWEEHTAAITKEYYALLAENEELERNIKLTQDKIKAKAEKDKVQIGTSYVLETSLVTTDIDNLISAVQNKASEVDIELANSQIDALEKWKDTLLNTVFDSYEDAYSAIHSFDFSGLDWAALGYDEDAVNSLLRDMEHVITTQKEYKKGTSEVIPVLENYNHLLDTQGTLTNAQNEDYIALMDSAGELYSGLKQLYDAGVPIGSTNEKFIQQYEQLAKKYNDAANATNTFGVSINRINQVAPQLKTYMDENGYSLNSFKAYCEKANISVTDLAKTLIKGSAAWTSYNQAAMAGFSNVMTQAEFMRHNNYRKQYGTYEEYLEAMQQKYEVDPKLSAIQQAFLDSLSGGTTTTGDGGGGNGSKTLTQAERNLQAFQKQHAYFEHRLNMGEITEEQYYYHLHDLMNMYLQDAENVETLWKYQEKVYKHSQEELQNYYQEQLDQQNALIDKINERFDAEIAGLEKSNEELEKQIEYEQLLEDMASAKAKKVLVFKNGAFQYVEDVDAISSAQSALDKYYRQQELERRKQELESQRTSALYPPQQEVARLEQLIKNMKGYAGGTTYSAGGLSLVGEHGAELAVLRQGTGILPADITKNLWAWGQTKPSTFMSAVSGMDAQGGNISFSGVTMSFPSVRNANDAQGFMQSVVNLAYQRAYSRK